MRAGVGFLAVVLLSITAAAALMKEQFVVEIRTDVLAEEFRSELTDYNLERMLAGDQEFDCYLPKPDSNVVQGPEQRQAAAKTTCYKSIRSIAAEDCFIHIVERRRFKICPGVAVYETSLDKGNAVFASFDYQNTQDSVLKVPQSPAEDAEGTAATSFFDKQAHHRIKRMLGNDGSVYSQLYRAPRDGQGSLPRREVELKFMCDLKHRRKPFATVLLEEETAAGDSPRTVLWIGVHAPSSSFCRQTVSTNEVLYALNHTCVAMPAGWWTYEMCFGKQLRQFHAEGTTSTQYILGKPGPDSATVVDNMGSASLVMNYGDGTTCDLTGQPRTTKVIIKCGDTHALTRVIEQSTCTYEAQVVMPEVCVHPALGGQVESPDEPTTIFCVPHMTVEL